MLVAIAVPSIRLLAKQYSPPPADLTVKVVGNQWYWTYQYPDNGGFEIVSNMLKECNDPTLAPGARCRKDNDGPPLLAVDERMVIPAGQVVKFIVTSDDVIHAFAVPAFWTKMDANPGKLNETWVKVDKPGVYFGQCSELCGARHGYMPIAVEVLAAGRVRGMGRVQGRHDARRPPGGRARQHRQLAGQHRGQSGRRPRRRRADRPARPKAPPSSSPRPTRPRSPRIKRQN